MTTSTTSCAPTSLTRSARAVAGLALCAVTGLLIGLLAPLDA